MVIYLAKPKSLTDRVPKNLPCEQMAEQDHQACTRYGQWLLPTSDVPTTKKDVSTTTILLLLLVSY